MSARTLFLEELARAPEAVTVELLAHLRALMPTKKAPEPSGTDYFLTHWNQFYGTLEGVEWNEPAELPYEKREAW